MRRALIDPASPVGLLAGLLPAGVAAALATWGIGFGLPFLFRPDEDVMVGRAVRMAAEGSLDPLFQNYPPLCFELFALAERVAALAGAATLVDPRSGDPSAAYMTGRLLSAAAATVTVALVFVLARRTYGPAAGLLAAMVLALAPLAVRQAHFATTDAVQVTFMTAAMAAAAAARRPRALFVAGALCGLAAASKYTGGAALVFVLALAVQRSERGPAVRAALAGAVAGFAVPASIALAHPLEYAGGLLFLGDRGFSQPFGGALGVVYHPTVTLPFGLGPGAYGLALLGTAVALWRRTPVDRALLAYAAVYLAVVGSGHEVFFRYALPLLPALAILAGRVLAQVPGRALPPALAVCGLLLLPSAAASAAADTLLTRTDSRVLAARWLDAHDASGRIDQGYYTGPFYDQAEVNHQLRYTAGDQLAAAFLQGRFSDRYSIGETGSSWRIVAVGPRALIAHPGGAEGAAVVIHGAGEGGVYDPLDAYFLPIWGFDQVERPGPTLAIIPAGD